MIVGGVDLLAKAEEQEKLLEESNMELEERRRRAEQLRKELEEKEVGYTPSYLEVVGHCVTCLCLFMWMKYDSTLKHSKKSNVLEACVTSAHLQDGVIFMSVGQPG